MSIMKYGGYKTEVIVPKENTYLAPKNEHFRSWRILVIYGTAFSAIVTKAKLKEMKYV